MPEIDIKQHAIDRYRERCPEAALMSDRAIMETIKALAADPDSIKVVKNGQFMVCGSWVLIRAENSIVTVYQGDVKSILRKKINPRKETHDAISDSVISDANLFPIRKRRGKAD